MDEPILEVKHLTTTFKRDVPVKVVDDLSFKLYPNKILALVGESGCGKSMTALSLMGLVPQGFEVAGQVMYKGDNLLELSGKRMRKLRGNRIAMVFQNPQSCLNPVYTVGEQLKEVLLYHLSMEEEEAYEKVMYALKEVGIPSPERRVEQYPHEMSGGMLQRVMIAMALILQPDILIADEPTTALDVTVQAQVLALIQSLQKEFNMATLLITHDLGVVAEVADHVLVMYASEGVEKGEVKTLFKNPTHPYTQGLFASLPKMKGDKLVPIKGFVPDLTKLPQGCHFHPRCPKVFAKCQKESPTPFFVGENHWSRCWLCEER